jgi:large subunit ribosomal protein L20
MPRVKRGVHHVKRRKNILKKTKGYRWGRKNQIKKAITASLKAGVHAYDHRRTKKRLNRRQWSVIINAGARANGMTYSTLIDGLKKKNIELDRKILSQLADLHPEVFTEVVKATK